VSCKGFIAFQLFKIADEQAPLLLFICPSLPTETSATPQKGEITITSPMMTLQPLQGLWTTLEMDELICAAGRVVPPE